MTPQIRIVIWAAWAGFCAIAVGQSQTNTAVMDATPVRILGLQYPRLAHLAIVQGKVEFEVTILSDGSVGQIKAVSGNPLLVDAAKDSLRRWRFRPCAPSVGQCRSKATFVFVLEKGACDLDRCPNEIQVDLPATVTIKSKPAKAIIN